MVNENPIGKTKLEILASDLSQEERSDMLSHIQQDKLDLSSSSSQEKDSSGDYSKSEIKGELLLKFNREPFLYRIFLLIKSFILSSNVEDIYNSSEVNSIAKKIAREFPDLIDIRGKNLSSGFYSALQDLKRAQDFFKPLLGSIESNTGVFYFILGYLVYPELSKNIKESCDVYVYPLTTPLSPDTRNSLMSKLDSILSEIPPGKKAEMAAFARGFEWLRMFVKLTLGQFLSKFLPGDGGHTASFSKIKTDYADFAKVIGNPVVCSEEIYSALHEVPSLPNDLWNYSPLSGEKNSKESNTASSELSLVVAFASKIPVKNIGKVVFGNSLYSPSVFNFGDNWLQRYREQWRVVLDRRWKLWNKDYRKEELKKRIALYFGCSDFPSFPCAPWKKVTDEDLSFKYDLSLGFLYFYLKEEYPSYSDVVKAITLEGDFSIQENRYEFSDMVTAFNSLIDRIDLLLIKLSNSGEYGEEFERLLILNNQEESDSKKSKSKEQLLLIMRDIEEEICGIIEAFSKRQKDFESLITSLSGEKTTVYYGSLSNLRKIKGRDNEKFLESLKKFAESVKRSGEVLVVIREIENM